MPPLIKEVRGKEISTTEKNDRRKPNNWGEGKWKDFSIGRESPKEEKEEDFPPLPSLRNMRINSSLSLKKG